VITNSGAATCFDLNCWRGDGVALKQERVARLCFFLHKCQYSNGGSATFVWKQVLVVEETDAAIQNG